MTQTAKRSLIIITSIALFAFGFLLVSSYTRTSRKVNLIYSALPPSNQNSLISNKKHIIDSFPYGHNSTHLWSMRLADESYFRLTRLLPCRNASYTGGPEPNTVDPCDHSANNEFSLPNILQAQKWLYDHQHPPDCSNKRFAIIHNFASSGFGSTVHQVAWALGVALAENRIAVYKTPGNWVRELFFSFERRPLCSVLLMMCFVAMTFLSKYLVRESVQISFDDWFCCSCMAAVLQALLIVFFFPSPIALFRPTSMATKQFMSGLTLVIGQSPSIHINSRTVRLIGIARN